METNWIFHLDLIRILLNYIALSKLVLLMTRRVRMAEAAVCYRRDNHGEQVPGAPSQGRGPREVQGAKGRRGADQGQLRHSGPIQTTLRGQEVIN